MREPITVEEPARSAMIGTARILVGSYAELDADEWRVLMGCLSDMEDKRDFDGISSTLCLASIVCPPIPLPDGTETSAPDHTIEADLVFWPCRKDCRIPNDTATIFRLLFEINCTGVVNGEPSYSYRRAGPMTERDIDVNLERFIDWSLRYGLVPPPPMRPDTGNPGGDGYAFQDVEDRFRA